MENITHLNYWKFEESVRTEYLKKEHEAYDLLVAAGYKPQGMDLETERLAIFKIHNEHTADEHTDRWYFGSWQEAAKELVAEEQL